MNIPVDENGMVHFKTCLFAMCREALSIYMTDGACLLRAEKSALIHRFTVVDEQAKADEELYALLRAYWPQHAKNRIVNLCMPQEDELEGMALTTGKIYIGYILLENWNARKYGIRQASGVNANA